MINTKKLKKSSHPVMFFIYLSLLVIVISGIADLLNFQVTYDKLTTIAGEVETTTVAVNSLLGIDGLKFLITSAYDNLVNFAPFASLLIGSIAFGIAFKSGFLRSLANKITSKLPKYVVVFLFSLLCILSSVDSHLGYVLLIPIGAVLFMSMGRNPVSGIALAFASIASGHGAGFFTTALDYNLSSYTEASSKLSDAEYIVSENCNLVFIIIAAILIATICTFITEKIVSKKLGRNTYEEDEEVVLDEKDEKRGLFAALIATVVCLIPVILMIVPSSKNGFIGLLLDKSQSDYVKMLFSSSALLMTNLVGIVSFLIALQGLVFGIASGTIKKIRDMVNFSTEYLKSIGGIFVLVFFASGLCAIFKETNLGTVITGTLSNIIAASNFSFMPLILLMLLFTIIINIFVPTSISKWSVMAPVIMPTIISANITPEFSQVIFRAGDSITNSISPLFPYFVIFIGFVEVFTKNKTDFSIKKCYKVITPYFASIALMWLVMIISWYIAGFPIGPGIYATF